MDASPSAAAGDDDWIRKDVEKTFGFKGVKLPPAWVPEAPCCDCAGAEVGAGRRSPVIGFTGLSKRNGESAMAWKKEF